MPDLITTADVCRTAGITYRQADYWVRCGYLRPHGATGQNAIERARASNNPGSGFARIWTSTEIGVATVMRRLIAVGIAVDLAADMARDHVETGVRAWRFVDGVTVRLQDPDELEPWT